VTVKVSLLRTVVDAQRVWLVESRAVRWTFHTVNDQGLLSLSRGWKVYRMEIPDVCQALVDCGG
jgi:hypothetical protein